MLPGPTGVKPLDASVSSAGEADRFQLLRRTKFSQPLAVIVGAAGACGLGIMRSLCAADIPVVLLDTNASAPAMHSRKAHKILVRALSGHALIDELLALRDALDDNPVLFLTSDETVLAVSEFQSELAGRFHIRLPAHGRLAALMHKSSFQQLAERNGFPVPRSVTIDREDGLAVLDALRFPCVVKPTVKTVLYYEGNFERGYRVVSADEAREVARRVLSVAPGVVVQEWIEGPDRDIYFCLQYRAKGTTVASFTGRKLSIWPPNVGMTASCTAAPEVHAALHPLTELFFEAMSFEGMGSMEFKRDSRTGEFLMIEPTVGRADWQEEVATLNGVNIPLAAYRHETGRGAEHGNVVTEPVIWRDMWMHWKASLNASKRGVGQRAKIHGAYWRLDDPLPAVYRVLGSLAAFF